LPLLLPDFALILCGYLLCRHSALNRQVWDQIDRLVYYFLFPVLLFHSIVKHPLDWQAARPLMGAGLCMAAAGIALAYSLPHWPLLGSRVDSRLHAAGAQVAFRFNSFIALALIDRVAGPAGLPLLALLIGLLVPVFNIGAVLPMARHAGGRLSRELARNPLILATASGLCANLLGLQLPDDMTPTLTRLGQAAIALGLLAAGPQGLHDAPEMILRVGVVLLQLQGLDARKAAQYQHPRVNTHQRWQALQTLATGSVDLGGSTHGFTNLGRTRCALRMVATANSSKGRPRTSASTCAMRGNSAGLLRPWGRPWARCSAV